MVVEVDGEEEVVEAVVEAAGWALVSIATDIQQGKLSVQLAWLEVDEAKEPTGFMPWTAGKSNAKTALANVGPPQRDI